MAINGVTTALNRPYMSFAIRRICIDGQTMYTFSRSHENLLSPTNEVQFIDCKQPIFTIGMDHNVVYMDHYSAGILDNPLCLQYLLMLLGHEMGHLKVYLSDNYGI